MRLRVSAQMLQIAAASEQGLRPSCAIRLAESEPAWAKIAVSGEYVESDCVSSPETTIFVREHEDCLVNEVICPANGGVPRNARGYVNSATRIKTKLSPSTSPQVVLITNRAQDQAIGERYTSYGTYGVPNNSWRGSMPLHASTRRAFVIDQLIGVDVPR
jgi:hypothetical protein